MRKLGIPEPIQFSCMVMRFMSSFKVVLGWIPSRQWLKANLKLTSSLILQSPDLILVFIMLETL